MQLKSLVIVAALMSVLIPAISKLAVADDQRDPGIGGDMELLQGSWELRHGNEGKGAPTIRSVKTIVGNRETLRRYSIETGELLGEKSVEFELNESGAVRVFTFYPIGGQAKFGGSYVYKVDKNEFYDITGLLHGTEYRDYSNVPTMWRWNRVIEKTDDEAPATDKSGKAEK